MNDFYNLRRTDLVLENKASTCTHTTIDGAPSYNNPLYEADGVGPSPTYEEIKPSPCENPISKNSFKID